MTCTTQSAGLTRTKCALSLSKRKEVEFSANAWGWQQPVDRTAVSTSLILQFR